MSFRGYVYTCETVFFKKLSLPQKVALLKISFAVENKVSEISNQVQQAKLGRCFSMYSKVLSDVMTCQTENVNLRIRFIGTLKTISN